MPKVIVSACVAIVLVAAIEWRSTDKSVRAIGAAPVVVELFTSQGCSSCPPADELLRRIARDAALRNKVIPLSFHVDYWNYLGWRDPFSQHAWTERQTSYVDAMGLSGAYTPQIVVSGTREMVGSNERGVFSAIEAESQRKIEGSVTIARDGDNVSIRAESPRKLDVVLVAYENEVTTRVERGENAGRTLTNDAIVRELRVVGTAPLATSVKMPARYGVVAFLQDRTTKKIDAVSSASSRP